MHYRISGVLGFIVALTVFTQGSPLPKDQTSISPQDYYVGKQWPTVPFEVPESWAGLMPIENVSKNNSIKNELFFWYWHILDKSEGRPDDLVIWLNGGPGCSSLEGMLQENGPVLFPFNVSGQPDQPYVKINEYSWTKLANVLYVEEPVGTGFSIGVVDANGYHEAAEEFYSFLKNFYSVFPENKGRRLWITGESDAGMMIPYIADYIYSNPNNETESYGINLKGISINDPSWTSDFFLLQSSVVPFVQHFPEYFNFSQSFFDSWYANISKSGLDNFLEDNLVYPPKPGYILPPPEYNNNVWDPWTAVYAEASSKNPNLNLYNIKQSVPIKDPLGFPPSSQDQSSKNILNDIPGFKKFIHAPDVFWEECSNGAVFTGTPPELPPAFTVLPNLIEKSERTIIQHGENDFLLQMNGSALAIQNMTWAGATGFSSKPISPLYVDSREAGIIHEERGLTFIQVFDSGHMIPQDQPAVAFRNLQYLLGLITYDQIQKPQTKIRPQPGLHLDHI